MLHYFPYRTARLLHTYLSLRGLFPDIIAHAMPGFNDTILF